MEGVGLKFPEEMAGRCVQTLSQKDYEFVGRTQLERELTSVVSILKLVRVKICSGRRECICLLKNPSRVLEGCASETELDRSLATGVLTPENFLCFLNMHRLGLCSKRPGYISSSTEFFRAPLHAPRTFFKYYQE
jgi:hypothetical protein